MLVTSCERGDAFKRDLELIWVGKVRGVVEYVDLGDADDTHGGDKGGWKEYRKSNASVKNNLYGGNTNKKKKKDATRS